MAQKIWEKSGSLTQKRKLSVFYFVWCWSSVSSKWLTLGDSLVWKFSLFTLTWWLMCMACNLLKSYIFKRVNCERAFFLTVVPFNNIEEVDYPNLLLIYLGKVMGVLRFSFLYSILMANESFFKGLCLFSLFLFSFTFWLFFFGLQKENEVKGSQNSYLWFFVL